jgi:hypothetical protein
MSLEQTIKATGTYRPQQAMAVGHVPAAANVEVYEYLSANYLEALHGELPCLPDESPLPDRIATILEHYAKAAANVRQFRLAQTWRIIAYAVDMLLQRRAQYHLERRMDRHHNSVRRKSEAKAKAKVKALGELFDRSIEAEMDGEETPRKIASMASFDKALHPRSLLSEELLESTSDVATPVARPVRDDSDIGQPEESGRGRKLTPIVEPESFTLPPPAHPQSLERRKRHDSVPLSVASHGSGATYASTEGYDFYDAEALFKAVDVPNSKPTPTQVLDYRKPDSPSRARKPLLRHDSEDSYVHLFSISDESRRTTGRTNSPDGSLGPQGARPAIIAEHRSESADHVGEFESGLHRKQLCRSPDREPIPPPRNLLQRAETDMTTFTDEHNAITQTTTDSFESQFPSQTDTEPYPESPIKQAPSNEGAITPDYDRSPFIVETDYLCWPDDLPYPYPAHPSSASSVASSSPLQPYSLISRALAFEAKSSALNASAIVLLLKPLLPEDVIDNFQAAAILRQHHSRLMSMKLFVEAALLRKLCMKGWPGGDLANWGDNYPAIFTTAQQGVQANFFCTSCHKPRDVDRTSGSSESIWHCERCEAVMAPCAVCGYRDTAPNVMPNPPLPTPHSKPWATHDEPILTTWWFCPGCGHGGHSSCLQSWHAALESTNYCSSYLDDPPGAESSDGCCPLDGCGHACLPGGRWRAESSVARTDEVSRVLREATRAVAKATAAAATAAAIGAGVAADEYGSGGGGDGDGGAGRVTYAAAAAAAAGAVRSDGYDIVPQSRAVETVREALAGAGTYGGGGRVGTGILSSSPGRGGVGGERERRKSVKFVGTEERW